MFNLNFGELSMFGENVAYSIVRPRMPWKPASTVSPDLRTALAAMLTNRHLTELDKTRSTTKVGGFGGAIFGSAAAATASVPPELAPLVPLHQNVTKHAAPARATAAAALGEYEKLANTTSPVPAPAVHAARLTGLLKNLANAEGAVTECIKARKELVSALEKILVANREALQDEEGRLDQLHMQSAWAENQKKDVELSIIGGLPLNPTEQSPGGHSSGSPVPEPDRPKVEALTPPHIQDHGDGYDDTAGHHNGQTHSVPVFKTEANSQAPASFSSAPGIEILSNLASQYQAVPINGSKKRKIGTADDFPDLGGDDGIDSEVAEMLRKDSNAS